MKRRAFSLSRRRAASAYGFLLPWLIGGACVFVAPLVLSISFSLSTVTVDSNGYSLIFTGLENYRLALFSDEKFLQYFATTMGDLLYEVPIILVYSFLVAVLLKEKFPGVTLFKFVFFLPVILSSDLFFGLLNNFGTVTSSTLDSVMNSASSGMLESLNLAKYLTKLGLSTKIVDMLTGPVDKVYEIVTCSGIQIFIFLAGIYSVPPDLYEAAHVEGANAWEKFWMITVPMVMPMILVNVIYSIVDTFISESNLVMTYVYELSFKNFNFGLSSAICWIYFAVIAAILAIVFAVINKRTFYYT